MRVSVVRDKENLIDDYKLINLTELCDNLSSGTVYFKFLIYFTLGQCSIYDRKLHNFRFISHTVFIMMQILLR